MDPNRLAQKTAIYLTGELAMDPGKTDTLRYGLEIIYGTIIKGTALFSLAYLLGILPEVAFAMVSRVLYRLLSGGAHCSSYWRCLTLGLLIFLGAGELGSYLGRCLPAGFLRHSLVAVYVLSFLCVMAWAPGEVPFKKITKISERVLFKTLSVACLSLWLAASMSVAVYYAPSLAFAGLVAVLVQTLSFSPPGYVAIHKFDGLWSRTNKLKEVSDQC